MGREIRKVPRNWKHPKDIEGRYIPIKLSAMPKRPPQGKSYFMMYENDSFGTPLSESFSSMDILKEWLEKNNIPIEEEMNENDIKRVKNAEKKRIKKLVRENQKEIKEELKKIEKKDGAVKRIIKKLKFWEK